MSVPIVLPTMGFLIKLVFFPNKGFICELEKIAKQNGIEIEPAVYLKHIYRFAPDGELSHLEQYLYAYPYKQYKVKHRVYRCFILLTYTEIEECSRDIIRLCRDRGFRYRDIAVITGNLQVTKNDRGYFFPSTKFHATSTEKSI